MSDYYPNHAYLSEVYRHKELPIFKTYEFDFWRCVEFKEEFYEKTVSELFQGNLRLSSATNRYSSLFPNQKLSYWASGKNIARDEIINHGSSKNIITFWGYDDASSTFPTLSKIRDPLTIVDGLQLGFENILQKTDENIKLTDKELDLIQRIFDESPDCIAYKSHVRKDGVNFLFFENGFNKLALREVELRGKNKKRIYCAQTSDYSPILKSYGECFLPLAKVKLDERYLNSDEYINREQIKKWHFGIFKTRT